MIKVTGLKKHFGDLEVLKGIDQHIKQGEKVVVIMALRVRVNQHF